MKLTACWLVWERKKLKAKKPVNVKCIHCYNGRGKTDTRAFVKENTSSL